ncbi:hypothetical protein C8Q77DRAFT_1156785 [Trametes polyzona]|nr:hypothetical protein C8Q77DRAFT_1156782 [Trametes polyzona]KAI0633919.1 hypothetical protein C8Q77DRAFT_1156785 [Trametes polyzona]
MSTENMLLFANLAIGGYDKARLPLRAKVIRSRGAGTKEVVLDGVQVLKDYIKLHPLTGPVNQQSSHGYIPGARQQGSVCGPREAMLIKVMGCLPAHSLGVLLALCVPYGSNTAAACVEPTAGVSMAALINTFALAPLTEKRTVNRLCVVFLYLDSVHVRDHVFAALRHSKGLYHKGLVTFSTKLTITNTQPSLA